MFLIQCTQEHVYLMLYLPKFSPPQISMSVSYFPVYMNLSLSIENKPPAIIGVLLKKVVPILIHNSLPNKATYMYFLCIYHVIFVD